MQINESETKQKYVMLYKSVAEHKQLISFILGNSSSYCILNNTAAVKQIIGLSLLNFWWRFN